MTKTILILSLITVVTRIMLDNLHLSLFLNVLGLGFEVIGFGWILVMERKSKDQHPSMIRPAIHLDDIENPIIKLHDLERQASDDLENRMLDPITVTCTTDKKPRTKCMGIWLITLGFLIQIGTTIFF
jgi:hypothetical protein